MNRAIKPISISQAAIKYKQVNEFRIICVEFWNPFFYYGCALDSLLFLLLLLLCAFHSVEFYSCFATLDALEFTSAAAPPPAAIGFIHFFALFIVATLIWFCFRFWSSHAIYTQFAVRPFVCVRMRIAHRAQTKALLLCTVDKMVNVLLLDAAPMGSPHV